MSRFEETVQKARETRDFMPVWNSFINTMFFVSVIPLGESPESSDFRFSIFQGPATKNKPMVLASEKPERLSGDDKVKAIRLQGGKLIGLLNQEVGIVVALNDGAFVIPGEQVQWLRSSIQSAN